MKHKNIKWIQQELGHAINAQIFEKSGIFCIPTIKIISACLKPLNVLKCDAEINNYCTKVFWMWIKSTPCYISGAHRRFWALKWWHLPLSPVQKTAHAALHKFFWPISASLQPESPLGVSNSVCMHYLENYICMSIFGSSLVRFLAI